MALRDWVEALRKVATPATTATATWNEPASVATVATVATRSTLQEALEPGRHEPGAECRRAKALAMLEANPASRIAVVAEAGSPAIVGIAIRGVGYGEIEIPAARYDPGALLAFLDDYVGCSSSITIH